MTDLTRYKNLADRAIEDALQSLSDVPKKLKEAMVYATAEGGKRVRPILVMLSAEAVGGSAENVLWLAAAVELIHSYSLVHDDLPEMDNDDMRRGKPTVHKKFGADFAVLAGDALLNLAFEILIENIKSEESRAAAYILARAAGASGMIAGQALDLSYSLNGATVSKLEKINSLKTGKLLSASAASGALAAGAPPHIVKALEEFGLCLGLAFQAVDDIMDDGKKTREEPNYLRLVGETGGKELAESYTRRAVECLTSLGGRGKALNEFAKLLLERKN